jgi:NAD-dependent dihydropyrimidine dehydrogenase PreA subunit
VRGEGIFIAVEVDDSAAADAELAGRLEEACPVDIFADRDGAVAIVEQNLDECVLCRLCIDATSPEQVKVLKLYDNEASLA